MRRWEESTEGDVAREWDLLRLPSSMAQVQQDETRARLRLRIRRAGAVRGLCSARQATAAAATTPRPASCSMGSRRPTHPNDGRRSAGKAMDTNKKREISSSRFCSHKEGRKERRAVGCETRTGGERREEERDKLSAHLHGTGRAIWTTDHTRSTRCHSPCVTCFNEPRSNAGACKQDQLRSLHCMCCGHLPPARCTPSLAPVCACRVRRLRPRAPTWPWRPATIT